MARNTPKVIHTTLIILGERAAAQIPVGTEAWFAWLDTAQLFAYHDGGASFTARKQHQRGYAYWYAYAKCATRVRCIYLGKSSDLTVERLEAVMNTLYPLADPPIGRYAAQIHGRRSPHTGTVQRQLAAIYDDAEAPRQQRVDLDHVRALLDDLSHVLTQHRQLDTIAGTLALDLGDALVTALEAERTQARTRLNLLEQALREAHARLGPQLLGQLGQAARGEVF
jgi:hypothetical protein